MAKSRHSITADRIQALSEVFMSKGWDLDDSENPDPTTFDRFCKTLARLTFDEQDYLISHSKFFSNHDWLSVHNAVADLLAEIPWPRGSHDGISVFPALDVSGVKNPKKALSARLDALATTKSGPLLTTILARTLSSSTRSKIGPVHFPERLSHLLRFHGKNPRAKIIIVDDYTGTGDTICGFIGFLREVCPHLFNGDQCFVVTPISHKMAIGRIQQEMGVQHSFRVTTTFSISDNAQYAGAVQHHQDLMKKMAATVDCHPDYFLGYQGCEDMVTVIDKAPNNTLGIYWCETSKNTPPFPRKRLPR